MSENKEQTAVEWLEKRIDYIIENYSGIHLKTNINEAVEQAKAMEKSQQTDDFINGMYKGQEIYLGEHKIKLDANSLDYSIKLFEKYYTETYGK